VPCKPLRTLTPFIPHTGSRPDDIRNLRFNFLNEEICFDGQIQWLPEKTSRLWRYNLHYFDYFNCEGGLEPDVAFRLAGNWIGNVPPGTRDAWDPFPLSLRLVNWIKYLSRENRLESAPSELVRSCYLQALWLERSLEYHLMGNHLFKNAKALIFCGLFFQGGAASRWLAKGTRILSNQLDEQILPDGGHFERSPMYHSMILEDCLDLLNVCSNYPHTGLKLLSDRLRGTIRPMLTFLLAMTHPDGAISLFNDAALGIEVTPYRLADYCEALAAKGRRVIPLRTPLSHYPALPPTLGSGYRQTFAAFCESGYFIMAPSEAHRLIVDCGQIGPDHQPGHAHSDTLSFELSIKGRRVIVDSGCSQYLDGDIRRYNRGNAGHNTITIDGINQSEVWGAHRCARRARPLYAVMDCDDEGTISFRGAHDGYVRLPGKPVHHRLITWSGAITIEDEIQGAGKHDIESRLHIHPDLGIKIGENRAVLTCDGEVLAKVSLMGEGHLEILPGLYCPEFGVTKKCTVLRVMFSCASLPFKTGWRIQP
jgi:uncharacterized heparinase superfamily protein